MKESFDRPTCWPPRKVHRWDWGGEYIHRDKRYLCMECRHCPTRRLTPIRGSGVDLYITEESGRLASGVWK